jgi:hypothetical protein
MQPQQNDWVWPSIQALTRAFPLPPELSLRLVRKDELKSLADKLRAWHPRIEAGVGSTFLDLAYLEANLVREDAPDHAMYGLCIVRAGEVCGFQSFERQPGTRVLRGRLGVLAPQARAGMLGAFGFLLFETVGKLVRADVLMTWVTLIAKHQQVFAERRGFQLSGLATGINCEQVGGKTVLVTEALYVKHLGNVEVERLRRENLTAHTQKALAALGAQALIDE